MFFHGHLRMMFFHCAQYNKNLRSSLGIMKICCPIISLQWTATIFFHAHLYTGMVSFLLCKTINNHKNVCSNVISRSCAHRKCGQADRQTNRVIPLYRQNKVCGVIKKKLTLESRDDGDNENTK